MKSPTFLNLSNISKAFQALNPHLAGKSGGKVSNGVLKVTLPLPPKELSPNARVHWAAKAAAAKAYRLRAHVEAGDHNCRHKAAMVQIDWFTKTARHMDRDNAQSSLKSGCDGITDSGFIIDDNELTFLPIRFQKDAKRPRVEITITPA